MSTDEAQRIFLIGAGTMARDHAHAARKLGRPVEIHAADPSLEARERFAKRSAEATLYEDADEMLALPARDGDLAIIAVPPWLHRRYIEAAARSGRHVLSEKPLLLSSEDIEPVARTLRETGRVLGSCSVRFLANPATRRVAELVDDGALGDVYAVRWLQGAHRMRAGIEIQQESSFFLDKSKNGGGVVMDWAPYDLTILCDILRPEAVRILHVTMVQPELPTDPAPKTVFDIETHAVATMLFETADGRSIPIHFERQCGSFERDLEESTISGTRGSVSWTCMGWQGDITMTLRNGDDEEGTARVLEAPSPDASWIGHAPLRETLKAIAGEPNRARVGGDALFEAAILRGLYDVADSGREKRIARNAFDGLPGASP